MSKAVMEEPVFNHSAHEKMWRWISGLSEIPEGFVEGSFNAFWLKANGYGELKNDCFACQYALEATVEGDCICMKCPLEWGEHHYCLHPGETLYSRRDAAEMFSKEWRKLSLITAKLPVKAGVKTI